MIWHQKEAAAVTEELESSLEGIGSEEALRRLEIHGPNKLKEKKKKTSLDILIGQFADFMILVLILAAIVSGFIGELSDTIAILVIVILNAVIGFIQEYRAEKAMAALKKMAALSATAIRDGHPQSVLRLILFPEMWCCSKPAWSCRPTCGCWSPLVEDGRGGPDGESVAVEKHTHALDDERLPIGDRKNMAYKGTYVTYGRGNGIVVATGMATELGQIATMLQEEEEVKTPLQKRLAGFGRKLAIVVLAICAIVFGVGIMRGEPPLLMLLTAISLAVAAIPEALPAVITISLALGARKLVRQNALIRKLPAVETLGSVTYICSDKTGTLTLNKMTVARLYADEGLIRPEELSPSGEETNAGGMPESAVLALCGAFQGHGPEQRCSTGE